MKSTAELVAEVVKLAGGRDQLFAGLERHESEARAIALELHAWTRQFPNQWIAIRDERLVGHSDSLEGLMACLDDAGVVRWGTHIYFTESPRRKYML